MKSSWWISDMILCNSLLFGFMSYTLDWLHTHTRPKNLWRVAGIYYNKIWKLAGGS